VQGYGHKYLYGLYGESYPKVPWCGAGRARCAVVAVRLQYLHLRTYSLWELGDAFLLRGSVRGTLAACRWEGSVGMDLFTPDFHPEQWHGLTCLTLTHFTLGHLVGPGREEGKLGRKKGG
jgi:hypothetical protein